MLGISWDVWKADLGHFENRDQFEGSHPNPDQEFQKGFHWDSSFREPSSQP
jgi:hypothetical protein